MYTFLGKSGGSLVGLACLCLCASCRAFFSFLLLLTTIFFSQIIKFVVPVPGFPFVGRVLLWGRYGIGFCEGEEEEKQTKSKPQQTGDRTREIFLSSCGAPSGRGSAHIEGCITFRRVVLGFGFCYE